MFPTMMITTVCLNDHEDKNNFSETWTSAAWGTLALRAPVIIWTEDTGADKENNFFCIWYLCFSSYFSFDHLTTRCECHPGYYELEGVCLDIDECESHTFFICHPPPPQKCLPSFLKSAQPDSPAPKHKLSPSLKV